MAKRITNRQVKEMLRLASMNYSVNAISQLLGISRTAVKYNTDPVYRMRHQDRTRGYARRQR